MAFSNAAVSDIIATTIESRTKNPADNLTNNNPLLFTLKKKGNVKYVTGGSIIDQEIMYNDPATGNAASFAGYDPLNITPDSPISAFQFALKHYASAISISGPEILANSGKEQMIDLLATRVEVSDARLANKIDLDLHGDGTGNSGKNIVGTLSMISTTPTVGTYGGVDRSVWAFARNFSTTSTIVNGVPATSANIQALMNNASLAVVRGNDKVDLIYMGNTAYTLYLQSLTSIQRITSDGSDSLAGAGFTALKFYGHGGNADVVYGGGIGGNQTATRIDFINTKHVFFRPHKDRNFTMIGSERQSINQDAVIRFQGWSGALTSDGPQFNAVALTT